MIGFGSYAAVYNHKSNADHVIKISRYGAKSNLDQEKETLKALQDDSSKIGIARFIEDEDVKVIIGGVEAKMPVLITVPRGRSLEMHIATVEGISCEYRNKELRAIGDRLSEAFDYVHENGFLHNDVSPQNIMVDKKGQAFLIDFGLASKENEKIKGFRGTASYAHRAIFRKYPSTEWVSKPEFDKTSLAFSMAAMSTDGMQELWKSFQPLSFTSDWHDE